MTLNELFPNTYRVLMEYGEDFVVKYRQALQEKRAIATGNLFRKVKYEVIYGSQAFELVLNLPEYSEYLEEGVNGKEKYQGSPYSFNHFPPRVAIEDWIRVKGIIPRRDDQGKLPTENQLSYLISRKIGLEGIKGRHMFRDTYEEGKDEWMIRINEALDKDIDENIMEILNNLVH